MKERKHKILNHPILGYFMLMFFALIISQVISAIIDNMILARSISGYAFTQTIMGKERSQAGGVGTAVGALLSIGLFYLWFRPYLCQKGRGNTDGKDHSRKVNSYCRGGRSCGRNRRLR